MGPPFEKETRLQPTPGVYAISINNLLGFSFSPRYRAYFAAFRERQPDARVAYSIFVYYIP